MNNQEPEVLIHVTDNTITAKEIIQEIVETKVM